MPLSSLLRRDLGAIFNRLHVSHNRQFHDTYSYGKGVARSAEGTPSIPFTCFHQSDVALSMTGEWEGRELHVVPSLDTRKEDSTKRV